MFSYILSIIIFLPIIGALTILFLGSKTKNSDFLSRSIALLFSVVNFGLSLYLWSEFSISNSAMQFTEKYILLERIGFAYSVGLDGISLFFVILSAFLTPICIISTISVKKRIKDYMIAFLILETTMIGSFLSLDLIVFYIFFEAVLIPMFIIIGIWGGPNRIYSAFKLFLYTLFGSLFFFIAIIIIINITSTSDIMVLQNHSFELGIQKWLFLAFFIAFAIKVPMFPFHTWLPDAHVEAPTAGSVILAGVLLKFGIYGFLRFSLPMFPEASLYFAPTIRFLSVVAVIYTSLIAFVQTDIKKLIAYSSIAHMGYVTAGIFTFNRYGLEGAVFQSLSHGIVSGALFLIVGVIYDRLHTRKIADYGGIANVMPIYAGLFLLFTMSSIGLPGTSGFVGEFLVMLGVFADNKFIAIFVASGMVLGAVYMLVLYKNTIWGEIKNEKLKSLKDLRPHELFSLTLLGIITLFMGIYPAPILDSIHTPVNNIIKKYPRIDANINNFILPPINDDMAENTNVSNTRTVAPNRNVATTSTNNTNTRK